MYAHVAGIPLEETALGLLPIAAVAIGGVVSGASRAGRVLHAFCAGHGGRSGR